MYNVYIYKKGSYDKELCYMKIDNLPRIGEMIHLGNESSSGIYNVDWEHGWRIIDIDYFFSKKSDSDFYCREVSIIVKEIG